jgi:DNA ligase-1
MRLSEVADLSEALALKPGRNAKVTLLAAALARLTPAEAPIVTAWLAGEVRQKTGIGPASLDAVLRSCDPGPGRDIEVAAVDAVLSELEGLNGPGSKERRHASLCGLMGPLDRSERSFLGRLLSGGLRQGALDGLVQAALAQAFGAEEAAVRRAVMLAGSLPEVAAALAARGVDALGEFRLTLGTPVAPMLADTLEGLDALPQNTLVEAKLDGARVQIHKSGDDVRIWSRALNEVTASLPDVVEAVRAMPIREGILDGEVLAFDGDGRPLPFQVTMRRFGRRHDVAAQTRTLPLRTFLFDALMIDGETLLDRPLEERRRRLEDRCGEMLSCTPAIWRPSPAEAARFLSETLANGHEGIMAKRLEGAYEAGQRGASWLKYKPAKSLDLVVIGAEWGSGRRSGWLSNLHLAARDEGPSGTRWVMLGKTFKGLTDETLAWQTEALLVRETHREDGVVWTRPDLVVEVAFQELEASTRYPGGVALRFARVKGYRPDKRPEQADTLATVRSIFEINRGA